MRFDHLCHHLGPLLILLPILVCLQPCDAITLVEEGQARATLILPAQAPPHIHEAADEIQHAIEQISSVSLARTTDPQSVQTPARIWLGYRHELTDRFPNEDFSLSQHEEIRLQVIGNDLILIGRDESIGGTQTQAGTHLAALTFLQDHLGVRWLWPGPGGTDYSRSPTIRLEPFEDRYHPPLRFRQLRASMYQRQGTNLRSLPGVPHTPEWLKDQDRQTRLWLNRHRLDHAPSGESPSALRGSLAFAGGHAFPLWWDRFQAQHPDWFALQHDGTRSAFPTQRDVKICVSNPGVAEQWLADAQREFASQPARTVKSASENDRGWMGYCLCENCRAWDNPQAPILETPLVWENHREAHYALTDRYVRFWNTLARGLRERFPDRQAHVGIYAYNALRPAPTRQALEENIMVAFVGIHRRDPIQNSHAHKTEHRQLWQQWAQMTHQLVWRPNLINQTAGLPYVFMFRHGENMNFLADHKLVGLDVDTLPGHWSTQGPQYYVTAQLAWNPRLRVEDILEDYYARAFGPAAESIAAYFDVFEQLYAWLAEHHTQWHRHADLVSLYRHPDRLAAKNSQTPYPPHGPQHEVEKRAGEHLAQAMRQVADAMPIYRERVAFIATGFAFTQAQLDAIETMTTWRDNPTAEARRQAEEAIARRDQILLANLNSFAFGYPQLQSFMQRNARYYGPLAP